VPTNKSSNVIVVGGGIVGASSAYFLQRAGVCVTLVESQHLAFGASGRNAGFIWLSLRPAGVQLELARAGLALYPGIVDDIGNSFEFRQHGGMIYCFNDGQLQVLNELATVRRGDGLRMEVVDSRRARELCPILPESVVGATYCHDDAQVYTAKFVCALGDTIRRRGGRVLEKTAVTGIRRFAGSVIGVDTSAGPIDADTVVVAMGSWSAPLLAGLDINLPVRPMRLQATATTPIKERFKPVLYGPLALKQYSLIRNLPSYRDDLFRSPTEASSTLEGIGITAKVFSEHIPALRDVEVDRSWACMLPSTPDSIPYIGRHPSCKGLIIAAGHVFGNAAGPITGKMVADLVTGGLSEMDMSAFDVTRHAASGLDEVVRW
jgi:glycine/D-amino acid oxidase-like deaminating enzyme